MAKIIFKRSGGLLGQTINTTLDLDSLPVSERQHLLRLIQEADFSHIPENLIARSTADEFLYSITVQVGATRHQIRVSDTSMPEALRTLISELATLAAVN